MVKVLYCKVPTNGKELTSFPLEVGTGTEPRPQRWEARVLPLCHCGPLMSEEKRIKGPHLKFQSYRKEAVTKAKKSDIFKHWVDPVIDKYGFIPLSEISLPNVSDSLEISKAEC